MAKNILNNIGALTQGLEEAMKADEKVILWGEDSGFEGGVFRATEGLQKQFGEERVWDAPIAEAGYTGLGVGVALYGYRPVVELQFQGFSYPAFQQIMTHAARFRNRSRGRFSVPMVIRMPMGGGVRALEHHSESIEILFAHIPGLKVVMPSNPYDTKGMIISAIKDNDPVIFLEPKKLYRSFKQEVPEGLYEVPIGKANVIKEGNTLSLVTFGAPVQDSLKAIQLLMETNPDIDVELIDLRTISPLDVDTVINSVRKTGRLLVVNEAVKSFSVSAEIIARVNENAFLNLIAPPTRLTGWDITVPLARGEKYHAISPERIIEKIKEVAYFEY
ncbi:MAG: alpha-ketoacid dehydrogenase subunit beta [Mycoplasma sp.]|nr:alpha-ketoacid dehydrogenase subunit beta [Mycoplasma sp.]